MNDTEETPVMYRLAEQIGKEYVFRGKILDQAAMVEFIGNMASSKLQGYKVIAGTSEECLIFMLKRLNQGKAKGGAYPLYAFYKGIDEEQIREIERKTIAEDMTGKHTFTTEEKSPGVYKHIFTPLPSGPDGWNDIDQAALRNYASWLDEMQSFNYNHYVGKEPPQTPNPLPTIEEAEEAYTKDLRRLEFYRWLVQAGKIGTEDDVHAPVE